MPPLGLSLCIISRKEWPIRSENSVCLMPLSEGKAVAVDYEIESKIIFSD